MTRSTAPATATTTAAAYGRPTNARRLTASAVIVMVVSPAPRGACSSRSVTFRGARPVITVRIPPLVVLPLNENSRDACGVPHVNVISDTL